MQKISLLFITLFYSIFGFSQTIVNGSFETWIAKGNKQAPASWDCDSSSIANGTIKKITGGSVGEFAIHLGTASISGNIEGALITRIDSLKVTPGNLLFDYKVLNNNTSAVNGLYVEIYFRDSKNKPLKDFNLTLSNNQSAFAKGELPISFSAGQVPKYYTLILSYFNVGGLTNESTVIDNVRFAGSSSVSNYSSISSIDCYPNPTKGQLNFLNNAADKLSMAKLISITGEESNFEIVNSAIDITNLSTGIYTLELYTTDNTVISRKKINLIL